MADRRMFHKTIVLSDDFLDMSATARCLYFTLSMFADDDGFINNPRSIIRQCAASQDDLKLLISKSYVIPFDSGVIVIRHWRINNYLRADRYTQTQFQAEKQSLKLVSGIYEPCDGEQVAGIPSGCQLVYPDKNRLDKNRIDKIKDISPEQKDDGEPSECEKPVWSFVLNDKTLHVVTQQEYTRYMELYPAVDIEQQFRAMTGWFEANPKRRKTAQGIKRFINSWLSKEQDKGGQVNANGRAQTYRGTVSGAPQPIGVGDTVI